MEAFAPRLDLSPVGLFSRRMHGVAFTIAETIRRRLLRDGVDA